MNQKEDRLNSLELAYFKARIQAGRKWDSVKRLVGLSARTGWEKVDVSFDYDEDQSAFFKTTYRLGCKELFLPRRVAYNAMTIPEELFFVAKRFGGRVTTEEDIQKFEGAFEGIDPNKIEDLAPYFDTFFRKFPKPEGGKNEFN